MPLLTIFGDTQNQQINEEASVGAILAPRYPPSVLRIWMLGVNGAFYASYLAIALS